MKKDFKLLGMPVYESDNLPDGKKVIVYPGSVRRTVMENEMELIIKCHVCGKNHPMATTPFPIEKYFPCPYLPNSLSADARHTEQG